MEKPVLAPKILFRPANGMRSTRLLVKIHNTNSYISMKWEIITIVQNSLLFTLNLDKRLSKICENPFEFKLINSINQKMLFLGVIV